ncbi:MAG: hypothetical protein CMJ18_28030 [Phycisphaeraceae bacterium]|nr:hypothetical protein [Phycisphaeraceae bacterium]
MDSRHLWDWSLGSNLVSARCVWVGAAGLIVFLLVVRALLRLRRTEGASRAAWSGDRGTASFEFVLLSPILLLSVLTLVQTALVMSGNLYVHYAAFCATRAAIVQIPRDDVLDEPANVIAQSRSSGKLSTIRRAAVFALVPVGGRMPEANEDAEAWVAALANMYESYGRTPPNWVERLAGQRLSYVDAHTAVYLLEVGEDAAGDVDYDELEDGEAMAYGPKDPVAVRVTHDLNLSIPYAKAIFADEVPDYGEARFVQATVRAHYTLTNEGISDRLPPRPAIPREP